MTLFNFGFWSLNLNQYVRRDDLVLSQDADDNQRGTRKYVPREAINESEVVFYPPLLAGIFTFNPTVHSSIFMPNY